MFAIMTLKTVAIHTLGCKVNFSESSSILNSLLEAGYEKKAIDELADLYIINTCSVTENADKECKQIVRKLKKQNPHSLVVVMGCYAQLQPDAIASIQGVNMVLGAKEKFNLPHHIETLSKEVNIKKTYSCDIADVNTFIPSASQHERTRVFLKIQDGCDYGCSFCTIPLARGKSRSNSIDNIVTQIKIIALQGVKEVVLTGINIGDFGKNSLQHKKENLLELLQILENIEEIPRFRISSIEPNLLSYPIIDLIAKSNRFMPHLHIPLQSGSNRILGLMRRRYQREAYIDTIYQIKKQIPDCAIGVDVIVGFPTETEIDFKQTYHLLEHIPISYLHVFTYSERKNTIASHIPGVVPIPIRHKRNKELRQLSQEKMNAFIKSNEGKCRKILFETQKTNGEMEGYSDNYIKVTIPYKKEWENQIINWIL